MSKCSKVILVAMVIVYAALMSFLSIRRHNAFASGYDLANMDQTVWETSRGNIFQLSGTGGLVSRFNFHADIILILLSPIYWIWNDVSALLIVQSLFLGLAAIPIFLIANKIWKNEKLAIVLSLTYLINPGVMWTNMYDFHGVSMAIFFTLMTVYFGLEKKWRKMFLFAVLAMTTKENVALAMVMVGVGLIVYLKEYKKGIQLIALSLGWFLVTVFVIMPISNSGKAHWVWEWYRMPKTESEGVVDNFVGNFIDSDAGKYYVQLLRPWGFLPILGLPWLAISGPELGINMLSSQAQMKSIVLHYDSMIIPGLVMAVIFGLRWIGIIIGRFKLSKRILYVPMLFMLAMAARENYFYSPLPTTKGLWKLMYRVGNDEKKFAELLKTIPTEAVISASSPIRPHLTHRVEAYNLPDGLEKSEYVAVVEQNRLVGNYNTNEYDSGLIEKLKIDSGYKVLGNEGPFWLFKKN